jgi:hypothetical protein
MFVTHQKEQFNIAYVGSLAAQAGINTNSPVVDNDSVDITLMGKGFTGGTYRNPHVDLQLKCTHAPTFVNNSISYALKRKNYDDLRATDLIYPKYLAVLVVDPDIENWSSYSQEGLLLKGHCYWASIKGAPDIDQEHISVHVPLSQVLTSKEVIRILQAASRRCDP